MKAYYSILPILLFLLCCPRVYANHAMAVDLTYTCLADTNDTYEITLDFYFDCGSTVIEEPLDTPLIQIASASCSAFFETRLTLVEVPTFMGLGREVSQLCDSILMNQLSNCHMAGGFPGVEKYTYKDTIQLPQVCTDWVFSYQLEGNETRSQTISNLDPAELSIARLYVEAQLNNTVVPCNSSPTFNAIPVYYFCNQRGAVTHGAVDIDGDSLVYTLVAPLAGPNMPINHRAGFSPQNPFPNNDFTFNPRTGQIDFVPLGAPQFPVVVVLVEEYRNGILIGSVMRDMQVVILDCINKGIEMSVEQTNNTTTTPTTETYFEFCAGDTIDVNFILFDGNVEDSLSFDTNIDAFPSGATFTTTLNPDPTINELTGNFFWIPELTDNGLYVFSVNISDNRCEISSQQSHTYTFRVFGEPYIQEDSLFYCLEGGPLLVEVVEGYDFNWVPTTDLTFLSADSSLVLIEPSFPEGQSQTYTVTNHCGFSDSVVVKFVEGFTVAIGGQTELCAGDTLTPLNITPSIAGEYDFAWAPTELLYFSDTPLPVTNTTETTTYFVTVTSPFGCSVVDSITVNVSTATDQINITVTDTFVCMGQSAQLNASLVQEVMLNCGANGTACGSPATTYTVGTGNNDTNDFTPYNTLNNATRIQLLYRAEELQASGMTAGVINSLAFNSLNISGNAGLEDMTIKMGCTSAAELQNFIAGLTEVFVTNDFLPMQGWNTHPLTTPYDWDGTSHIVVEVCLNKTDNIVFNRVATNTTTFNSFKRVVTNAPNQDACSLTNSTSTANAVINERPIIQFGSCLPDAPLPVGTSISWNPTTGLSDPTIANPIAMPAQTTTYTVGFDTPGNCAGNQEITLYVPDITSITADTSICDASVTHTIPLQLTGDFPPNTTYEWMPTTGLSDPFIRNPIATVNSSVTYTINVNDQKCNTILTDSVTITIGTLGTTSVSKDTSICIGEGVNLLATGGTDYNWSPTTGLSNPNSANPLAQPATTTTYQVDISNGGDCLETLAVTVTVLDNIALNLMPNNQTVTAGQPVLLEATGNFDFIEWVPTTGLTDPFSPNPTATINETTTYIAIATTTDGCIAIDSVTFTTVSCQALLMPTAFSPNGDNMNEEFAPLAGSYDELLAFRVYSRWGELLFSANESSIVKTWDGTFSQEIQPVGTYVYYVQARCEDKILEQEGWVVLVR